MTAPCSPLPAIAMGHACAKFVMWALMNGSWQGAGIDGGAAQDKAAELGLIVETIYDPEQHGPNDCCDAGDSWYVPTEALANLISGGGQAVPMPWPSREIVAREIRRAMLDNPTAGTFNKREAEREKVADDAAEAILARFAQSIAPAQDEDEIDASGAPHSGIRGAAQAPVMPTSIAVTFEMIDAGAQAMADNDTADGSSWAHLAEHCLRGALSIAQPTQGGDKGEAVREALQMFVDWGLGGFKGSLSEQHDKAMKAGMAALAAPQPASNAPDQDLGCLKFYIENMNEANWKDMRMHAERQIERMGTGAVAYGSREVENLRAAAAGYLATFDRCAGSSSAVEAEEFSDGRQAMRDALSAMSSTQKQTPANFVTIPTNLAQRLRDHLQQADSFVWLDEIQMLDAAIPPTETDPPSKSRCTCRPLTRYAGDEHDPDCAGALHTSRGSS